MPPSAQWSSTAQARSTPLPTMTERSTVYPQRQYRRGVPFSTTFFASFNDGAILSPFCGAAYRRLYWYPKPQSQLPATAGQPLTYFIQMSTTVRIPPGTPCSSMQCRRSFSFRNTPSTAAPPGSLGPVRSRWDIPAGVSVTVLLRGMLTPPPPAPFPIPPQYPPHL